MSQDTTPGIYHITADTAANINLQPNYWRMLEDPAGNLTIQQVSTPAYAGRFRLYDSTKNTDFSIRTFWLKYHFKNDMPRAVKLDLLIKLLRKWK
ncbi:MAG: hypothetical protein NVS3B8_06140 [Chitinophagaceae bacterium]